MLRPGTFFLDGVAGTFPGFTSGETWNGWATPLFSRDVALQIAAALRSTPTSTEGPMELRYDEDEDAFVLHDPFYPDEPTVWEATHDPSVPQPLYPIGTWTWTWEERDAPATPPSPDVTYHTLLVTYEVGPDPLTGEMLPEERETITLAAPTPEAAARVCMGHARISPRGRLVRYHTLDGRQIFSI